MEIKMSGKVKGNQFNLLDNTELYIGTKTSMAKEMNRADYNRFRGWSLPDNEDGNDNGYIVQYANGYVSWSPADQFNEAYKKTSGLSFGLAIDAMKKGKAARRLGWNGIGIFIGIQYPSNLSKMTSPYLFIDTTGLKTSNEDAPKSLVPWLASQTDMLSTDWVILD